MMTQSQMTIFYFLIQLILLPSLQSTQDSQHFEQRSVNFLENLITSRFLHCALLFYRDRFHLERNGNILRALVIKTQTVYYNVQHVYPLPQEELGMNGMNNLQKYHLISAESTFSYNYNISNKSLPVEFGERISNYNRKADMCKIVILMLSDVRPSFIELIYKTITPVYSPITHKDSDPFIFITKEELMEPLLLTYELPARTKYKIAISENTKTSSLIIKSVCFFCDGGNPRVVVMSPTEDPKVFNYFPDYVRNLNGKTLRVACPAILSRVEVPRPWTGVNNAKRGMWKNLLEDFLMLKFNFTYNIFLSTGMDGNKGGGGTGLELPNGTWIGTVGDVAAGRADIAIITANTPKRIRQISFTNSFFDISFLNFITKDGTRIFSPVALLWPFDLLMWFCIFLSTLLAFLVFWVLTRFMDYLGLDSEMSFARRGQVSKESWGLKHQIFFVGTTYLDQDCVLPRFTPLRCFVALWLFFTLIITTIFRSKMVSLLAFPVLEKLPKTFDDLVQSDYQVGFIKHGDSAYNTLKASTDLVYVKLLEEMEIITGVGLECLERVVAKKYACIAYDFSTIYLKARNLSDSDIRKLVFAPETTYNIFMGLGLDGGSIYKEGFEKWLGWTRPFHLANLWEERDMYYNVRLPKREWWTHTNQTEKLKKHDEEENSDLTLKHISGAFYSLVLGLLTGTLIFLQELWYFYKKCSGKFIFKICYK